MYKDKKFVCVIPARGGSKSIPFKNLQKVGEHSLLGRSINHAKNCELIDEIYVSTNDPDIRKEALSYSAKIIDRPEDISGPRSTTEETMLHSLYFFEADYIVLLQPTSPFRSMSLIERCIKRIVEEEADSLVACWRFHNFCFYQIIEGGMWHSTFDFMDRPMRQTLDIKSWFNFDTGVCYLTKIDFLKKHKCRLGGKISIENVSMLEMMQIDEMDDLEICKKIVNGEIK